MSESKQEVAFRYAVERVNANRNILPKSLLSAQIEKIPPQDSFHASKRGWSLKMPLLILNSQLLRSVAIMFIGMIKRLNSERCPRGMV